MSIFVKMKQLWQGIKQSKEKNYLEWNSFTFIGIALLIICGIKVSWHLEQYMDIVFWDESLYLTRGVSMFKEIPKTWGPSYSLWYKMLSYFFTDKLDLYYFNFKFTTILISVAFFLLLMSCGIQRILAFIFSLFFLSSFINLPLWPRVSHFCVIVLITGILIAKYHKTTVSKVAILSVALLVCSYARPELFLPFMVSLAGMYGLFFINIKKNTTYDILLTTSLSVFFIFIYIFLKTPFNNGDSTRGIRVFLQHFAMNYAQWNHSNNIFWLDFADIIKANFKDASTLKEMIAVNPQMIKHHILSNISNYSIQMGKVIFSFFAPIFTKEIHWLTLMISTMLFGVYFSFTHSIKDKRRKILQLIKENLLTILVIFLFALPSFFVCVYAYPREHYLLLQVPLFLLIVAMVVSSISVNIYKSVQKIIVIAVIWFFVTPEAEDFSYFRMFRADDNLSNQTSVKYIKNYFPATDTVRVFDVEGNVTNMLPPNFVNVNHIYLRDRNKILLSDFILQNGFDIIYNTPTISKLNSVQKDTVFFDMLKSPEKYGYFEQKTGNFAMNLLIKKK